MKSLREEPSALKWRSAGLPELDPERNLTERTAWILQAYETFIAMSNNALRTVPKLKKVKDATSRKASDFPEFTDATNYGSLEDIHNAVHNLVGGKGGHMSGIEVSAFDPMFWLRKCLVTK